MREADLATLLQRELSVLILADRPLPAGAERDALTKWVEQGGLLIRFAGPRTAEQPIGETDSLMPVKLLGGDRQLGGALSWSEPAGVAQFTASSPFAGLAVPDEVKVNRQVLAEPSADLAGAHLGGTGRRHAAGDRRPRAARAAWCCSTSPPTPTGPTCRCPACSWTCCAGWSRCRRASRRPPTTPCWRPPRRWTATACCRQPPQAATGLPANEIARTVASPRHPPGLYGPENGRRALNLGANLPAPEAAPPVPGARIEDYAAAAPERALGPALLAVAVVLLALDLLIALGLRGLLRPSRVAAGAAARACWLHRRRTRWTAIPTRRWRRGLAIS